MIALGTFFIIAKCCIQIRKQKFWPVQDSAVLLAWACQVSLCIADIKVARAMYHALEVQAGKISAYQGLLEDTRFLLKVVFATSLLLWCSLWLVKFALLLNCRRLIVRQPAYHCSWWCIVSFCAITFVGCIITEFMSCGSLHAWFTPGSSSSEFGNMQTDRVQASARRHVIYTHPQSASTSALPST